MKVRAESVVFWCCKGDVIKVVGSFEMYCNDRLVLVNGFEISVLVCLFSGLGYWPLERESLKYSIRTRVLSYMCITRRHLVGRIGASVSCFLSPSWLLIGVVIARVSICPLLSSWTTLVDLRITMMSL